MAARRRATRGRRGVTAAKRRVVVAVLAAVALWPLAHRLVVARFDVNPWKLGGWAMYTVPTPALLVGVFRPHPRGHALIAPASLPTPVQLVLQRFERERHALGDLRPPDDVAAAVLQSYPELPRVDVVVQRMVLDPQTARMAARKVRYTYDRDGRRERRVLGDAPAA